MALSDVQIERYSRQIILPEIGGRGQERLLAAVVVIEGTGELATTAASYLAGAGIGALRLDAAAVDALGGALRRLNPDVTVRAGSADAATTVVIAADLALEALDRCARRARGLGVPLVAAARLADGGWLHAPATAADCAGCAARAAAAVHGHDSAPSLDVVAAGVLGSLLALAALEHAFGGSCALAPLRWFAAETSLLTPLAVTRFADCGGCASAVEIPSP